MTLGIGAAALVGGAAALGGAAISANASKSAASSQAQSSSNALEMQLGTYEANNEMINPFVVAGQGATQTLDNDLYGGNGTLGGNFTPQDYLNNQDPGYGFQLNQGQQALQNSQASQDGVLSGSALKGLINYNQGAASTGYQNAYNRWLSTQQNTYGQLHDMATLGANAQLGVGTQNVNSANGASSALTNIGNAQASGTVGSANALSSGLSNGAGYYYLNSMLNNNNNNSTTPAYLNENNYVPADGSAIGD